MDHAIELVPDAQMLAQRGYTSGASQQKQLDEFLEENLKADI